MEENKHTCDIPSYFITERELEIKLKDFYNNVNVTLDKTPVIMTDNGNLNLTYNNLGEISLNVYSAPKASIDISPRSVEYGQKYTPYPAEISVEVSQQDLNNIQKMTIGGGNIFEDVTTTLRTFDYINTTSPSEYTLTYESKNGQSNTASVTTVVTRRVLYGSTEPTAENFFDYDGDVYQSTGQNPNTITITQNEGEYGYIASPYKVSQFIDREIGLPGGWLESYTIFDSPYDDGLSYYVYRTRHSGLGNVTWEVK